jgi:hypothetical protein
MGHRALVVQLARKLRHVKLRGNVMAKQGAVYGNRNAAGPHLGTGRSIYHPTMSNDQYMTAKNKVTSIPRGAAIGAAIGTGVGVAFGAAVGDYSYLPRNIAAGAAGGLLGTALNRMAIKGHEENVRAMRAQGKDPFAHIKKK